MSEILPQRHDDAVSSLVTIMTELPRLPQQAPCIVKARAPAMT
jgi:hypothetical protein